MDKKLIHVEDWNTFLFLRFALLLLIVVNFLLTLFRSVLQLKGDIWSSSSSGLNCELSSTAS